MDLAIQLNDQLQPRTVESAMKMLIRDCRRNLNPASLRSRRISHIPRSAGVGDARRI